MNFYSFDKYTNYKVLKCYKLFFDLNRFKKNIGSYILLSIILSFIVAMIINIKIQNKNYEKMLDEIIDINLTFDKKLKIDKNKNIDNKNNQIDINNNDKNILYLKILIIKKMKTIKKYYYLHLVMI